MNLYYMPSKADLEQSLLSGDEEVILAALKAAKKAYRRRHLNEILLILSNTRSPRVRNAAAVAVADLRSEKAKEVLTNLLVRDDTKKSRGTLLYVLDEIGASIPIDVLTDVIATSRYEAQEEALGFLKSRRIDWDRQKLQRSIQKLQRMTRSKNADRSKAAERALKLAAKLPKMERHSTGTKTAPKSNLEKSA